MGNKKFKAKLKSRAEYDARESEKSIMLRYLDLKMKELELLGDRHGVSLMRDLAWDVEKDLHHRISLD